MHTGLDLLLSDVLTFLIDLLKSEPTWPFTVQSDVKPLFRLCRDRYLKVNKTLGQSKCLEITKKVIPFHQTL